jgi:hypothetical protein
MIFSENRFTLCANAALRVRIMPCSGEVFGALLYHLVLPCDNLEIEGRMNKITINVV